jgi:hypothetical protein
VNGDAVFDDLLLRVGDAFEHDLDPVPPSLLDAAFTAFSWRNADAELAELLFDSASDELVGVRGTSTERRSFRYGANSAVVRVHLTSTSLIVMIEPPLSVLCRVVTAEGSIEERTDDLGELVVDAPVLPVRIEVDLPSGEIVTPWIIG